MKTILRWVGVVFLPIPALFIFAVLAGFLSNFFAFIDPWDGSGNRFGLTVAAGALVINIVHEMAPCGGRYASMCWAIVIAGANIAGLIFAWNEYTRADVVQTIALILGPCLGAYWAIKE